MDHSYHHHHHHHSGESEVKVNVTYKDGKISIALEDNTGKAPELALAHEKEMHFIMVSNDLEQYYHLHPEKEQGGLYTINQLIKDGTYKAFVDITPKEKAYQAAPNPVQVGTKATGEAFLKPDDDWTKEVDGKTVTLEDIKAETGKAIPLVFNMHGETPEPHLGALGHVVIIDEAAEQYIHVHPDSDDTTTFHAHFPKQGMYKIWAEFEFDNKVYTYSFTIEVSQ
ncbi:hypothetical protein [Oceanobacillus jeddahense]|uniref:DUF4198 domain-containing protein n=1 Tax=Oceanobacillus jeddahense TaxID=1462527 RepID=A0ABY5JZM8_9BACI|nr:hypothetical protein [Oceanobacillus jeddahense]UUI04613.1 hypothetical protein NP439_08155 [Oceanobacillus jeddahense]